MSASSAPRISFSLSSSLPDRDNLSESEFDQNDVGDGPSLSSAQPTMSYTTTAASANSVPSTSSSCDSSSSLSSSSLSSSSPRLFDAGKVCFINLGGCSSISPTGLHVPSHSQVTLFSVPVNTIKPIHFDTPHVSGQFIFKLRPTRDFSSFSSLSPAYQAYFNANPKIQFEISAQIRFKQSNQNPVFIGGQLSHTEPFAMNLNFLKRNSCKLLLNLTSGLISGLNWSMGAGDGKKEEFPFIAFPLVKAADRFAAHPLTAVNEIPPLDASLVPYTFNRKDYSSSFTFQTNQIYTISFFSCNLDLDRWQIVNLPSAMGNWNLHQFWENYPLKLQIYELINPSLPHSEANKKVLLAFQVAPNAQIN
jgi:hypothetical protein